MNTRRTALVPVILTASITIDGITLAACSQTAAAPETTTAASTADNADANADANPEQDSPAEVSGPEARLVATYDGGKIGRASCRERV